MLKEIKIIALIILLVVTTLSLNYIDADASINLTLAKNLVIRVESSQYGKTEYFSKGNKACGYITTSNGKLNYLIKDMYSYNYKDDISQNFTGLTWSTVNANEVTFNNLIMFSDEISATTWWDTGTITDINKLVTYPSNYILSGNTLVDTNTMSHIYDLSIPTIKGLTLTWKTPKLFETLSTTQIYKWIPDNYNVEVKLKYSYNEDGVFNSDTLINKTCYFKKYQDGLLGSAGTVSYLTTEMVDFVYANILNSQIPKDDISVNMVSFRYAKIIDGSIKYGNWVNIDLVTGGSIDDGNVQSSYSEVDENGNNVIDSEYNGKVTQGDGTVIPTSQSFNNLSDYLKAIPGLFDSLFKTLFTLISSIGNMSAAFGQLFVGMPTEIFGLISLGIGLTIVFGVIKFLRG